MRLLETTYLRLQQETNKKYGKLSKIKIVHLRNLKTKICEHFKVSSDRFPSWK